MLIKVWLLISLVFYGYNNVIRVILQRIYIHRKLKVVNNENVRQKISMAYQQISQGSVTKGNDQFISLVNAHQNLTAEEIYQIYLQIILNKLPFTKISHKIYIISLFASTLYVFYVS